jgi:hypothetical protein
MVRRMVEEGAALIVMGNHEFNAVAYHTHDPERPGEWLRPHDVKNTDQHEKTLAEFEARPNEARELLDWFATLPLYLDLPEIRVVHACWCRQSIAALLPLLNPDGSMPESVFAAACRKGSPERKARDILVSGPEITLPDGQTFKYKDGQPRTEMRLQWWLCGDGPLSLKQAGLGLNDEQLNKLPNDFVSPEISARFAPDGKPTFFGHYWLTEMPPAPSSPNATCLDYSVARGGTLVAYRWDGEPELSQEKFCY